ncbi:MAG: SOS response-associated peptidase [Anaerolineae bacterium]|nr:SOS response-associated peptidase [Anaerolineae bacterium]
MCGRFTLLVPAEELAQAFDLPSIPEVAPPRYNIAPTQPVAIVRLDQARGERELAYVNWGLIPFWADDPSIGNRMINARAETAAEKPAFRAAFKYRRCLVPASGFYEWQKRNGAKQPYYIYAAQGRVLGLAGLWERWTDPDGSEIQSCTILTTGPSGDVSSLHNRMPLILDPADYGTWLHSDGTNMDELQHLLRPAPEGTLAAEPVSTYVNRPGNEGPECIAPLAE